MPPIRILFLWHMHQPFYKDLVTGEYRLPWVRLHALKDYYGMVKLLDEFPGIHQNFNIVPSLITQIQDYVAGTAKDPFFDVAAKPAADLSPGERRFALRYLFQANLTNLIRRYPRYAELYEKLESYDHQPEVAEKQFTTQEFADLQVLSQLAWFDEFALEAPGPALQALIAKGRDFTRADQEFVLAKAKEILASVLPAYAAAAKRGQIELSTSPFYHPILPLLCDTDIGAVSSPGLPLPQRRFAHPEDASDQLVRGLDLHERVFGMRPRGVWPSEGSVSEQALAIANSTGVQWMATDEGVLGRSIGAFFARHDGDILIPQSAAQLYNIYHYERDDTQMHLVFRDHALSDLIGFVYSGMPAQEAVTHFIGKVKKSCQALRDKGQTPVVPVILDGENAWEFFPRSGREFLRLLYSTIERDADFESLTISEAIARHGDANFAKLDRLTPGSWINANFNVWIGAPEDNRAWDYLTAARDFYAENSPNATPEQRALAYEELLIAEGSDWNWWYGPEHSTANDRDFDELYRKHLANVYQALGGTPPEELAQPILRRAQRAEFIEQSGFIHPKLDGISVGYFDWIGAAHYRADIHGGAMHGKRFLLDSVHTGINDHYLFMRVDFGPDALGAARDGDEHVQGTFDVVQTIECLGADGTLKEPVSRMIVHIQNGEKHSWTLEPIADPRLMAHRPDVVVRLGRILESRISLDYLQARIGDTLQLRFSVWENKIPTDSLPPEGMMKVKIVTEDQLAALTTGENWKA
jgi:alpha-amylase/alpha-mannosidase (GH57 family)